MGLIYSDIPELIGSDTEISLRNLSELEDRLNRIVEERIAHIDELARAIVKEGEDADIVKKYHPFTQARKLFGLRRNMRG